MKSTLPTLISILLLSFTFYMGDLKANTECFSTTATECEDSPEDLTSSPDNYCYAPDWHYTYGITQNSATFEWEAVYGATYYTVQWRYPGGSWYTLQSYCSQTWINMGNLLPCTAYEWRVQSHCSYGYSSPWCYSVYFTTLCDYCHAPDWQQCYNITDCCATWKWGGVPGADCYSIQWCANGGTWYDLSGGNIYGTWVNVNHLNPCTSYQWRVRSYCHNSGWSNWCYPYTFTTTCNTSCAVPSGLITKDIGDYKATFKWSPVYGANSYSVQIKDYNGYWYDVPGSPTSGLWITVSNLSSCKSYQWRVRANCNYYSSSAWSYAQSFTTSCGHGCYAPDWVYTNGITPSSASLHWAPVSGADFYVVEWRTAGGTWYEMQGGPWTNTVIELTGLQPNTAYEWRVKSHCYSGYFSGYSSVTYFTTSGSSCGMPFFRWTTPITDSTATFNWTAVSGAVNYTVQIRPVNGQYQDVVGSPTTATSITAAGLSPNTTYEWRMQVNCGNGAYSVWLSSINFTTGISNGCKTPTGLFTDQLTLNTATLHWTTVPGAQSYSVEIRALPAGAWNPVAGSPVDTNFIIVDGLSGFTPYEWHVRANCEGGNQSFWSGSVPFTTTNLPPCNSPDSLKSTALTETTATFSWGRVTGAQGYQVQTRLPNGVWIDLLGGTVLDSFVLATGFTPNTTYEWHVRTQCDSSQFSNWSPSRLFTTLGSGPGNDNCSSAMLLTVETSCVPTFASNVDATSSTPPPAGGCGVAGYKDVWFKFTMPDVANPAVTIRTSAGSLGNAVMEVYSGNDCNILSVIACEDNNDNGNGSSMPVINLTGTPNATIWVRVWGYGGSTGTFTICVFNYISFNYGVVSDTNVPEEGAPTVDLEKVITTPLESKPGIQLRPNPVSDILNVDVLQTENSQVMGLRIMDLSGKIMFTQDVERPVENHFNTDVDVSNLVPGIYLLQVQTTAGVMAEKVSVIR
jgi:hypothetical protein